ncbi:MAG TPA: response regulator [Chloroflexota bacterium]|jgi:CheY-like chemotaxis protein
METPERFLVLIVEDEGSIAGVLSAFVEDLGYAAMVAPHGVAALEMARARWPALVLTDYMMPLMSGSRLLSELRSVSLSTGRTMPPIILMSAVSPRLSEMAGADVVLAKPFDLARLEALLERFLGRPA